MIIVRPHTFCGVFENLTNLMRRAPQVRTERWQGVDVSRDPSAATYELKNVAVEVDLRGIEDLGHWREEIGPNLPWADDHFLERVCGSPLNPGKEWENWPWATSADRFRDGGMFNHTYSERLWPKWPRKGNGGDYSGDTQLGRSLPIRNEPRVRSVTMRGISHEYGDLQDLVELIAREPHTRQAYIPLFFPEDTGVGDGGRKPCTLGYQFTVRDNRLNIFYPMRSVDLRRHFRDDVYLAVRLLLWVLDRCRERDAGFWDDVKPGTYAMWMTSLHIFVNDSIELTQNNGWD